MRTKIFFACLSLIICTSNVFAATKEIRRGSFIDRFKIVNAVDPQFEGAIVIVLENALHKVIWQPSAADHTMEIAYCNQVLQDDDPGCETFDPDPLYAEWDAASQVADGNLTPANKRKWLWAWKFINYDLPEHKANKTWLNTQSGYNLAGRHRAFQGGLVTKGWSQTDADACATKMINNNENACFYSDNSILHIDGRTKQMVDELHDAVIDLP